MNRFLDHVMDYTWAYICILVMIGLIGYAINVNSEPPEGYAGWSIAEIEGCYLTGNNSLERYHMCRDNEWKGWYCMDLHDKWDTCKDRLNITNITEKGLEDIDYCQGIEVELPDYSNSFAFCSNNTVHIRGLNIISNAKTSMANVNLTKEEIEFLYAEGKHSNPYAEVEGDNPVIKDSKRQP